ncbi:unnamed protein product [Oikopleura dioica]|uniref:Cysteine dioxygenase n=1 Tax=Oikopleura dioica TaxID=34765 RepID=E4YF63_OIKDI|nr:unnamed protein product [Oikopleura dioica]
MALETAKRPALEKPSRKASQVWKTLSDSLRPKTKSTDDIILQLQKCFLKELGPDQAQKLLKSADCSLFEEKAEFDDFGYKRILIEENEKFNLVLMCWPEGSATSIHDHTGSECIMKCLAGKIRETRYKWPVKKRQSLEKICEEDLKKNEVSGINDEEGLHLIENPSTAERAISLHLYYPPLSECLVFDEYTGKARRIRLKLS